MMEGQENVSTTAAPSSVAREGLLVLPTSEHVSLHQSQLAAGAQQQAVETQIPASAVGPVNNRSGFSAVNVEAAAALSCLSSYNEIVGKLNRMWEDQMTVIRNVDDSHWKNPEFPLARIKKIMRMDEEVKMISSEVPLMLSKAVEIFVTELTLRAWLHTEESKRRTVQRSDIALAITKQDMFDFLIDIVPREEIQLKSKTQPKQGESDQLQLLTPELLQLYLQHISQQQQQQQTSTNSTTQQPQPQQQQRHHHQTSQTLVQLQQLQSSQQQKQQQAQQQIITHQQQQQQLVDTLVGDLDEASVKIFQDNVALLQQLQQLVQLQLQVQQLQEATSAGSAGDHAQSGGASIHLPTSEPLTLSHTASHEILVSSVLNQPQQVMETTDSIHRVTINAANDMLSDSELHSAISSISSSSRESLRPASSLLSSLPPSSSSSSSASQLRRSMTSVPMVIEPELVETGALANSPSPSSSHDLLDDSTADSATRGLLAGEHVPTQPVASHGQSVQTSSSVPLTVSSTSADTLTRQVSQGGGGGGTVSTAQLQQLHHQLEPQISNILSQTGTDGSDEPEQYVVQTAPLLELVSSAHTVTIHPTSAAGGNLTSIVQTGAEIPVAMSNQQSSSTLTPINAALDSSEQFLCSISTDDSTPMEH